MEDNTQKDRDLFRRMDELIAGPDVGIAEIHGIDPDIVIEGEFYL